MGVHMLCTASSIWELLWAALARLVRERYRPERHYMRGPGPKYRAKDGEGNAGKPDAATSETDQSKVA